MLLFKMPMIVDLPTNLCMFIQMALNNICFASNEGFSTVIAIATFGFYLSYGRPLFVRLLSLWTGHAKLIPGAHSLGKYGKRLNGIGLLFLISEGVDFNFQQLGPVRADNMNYCSAAFGIIGLVSVVTWVFDTRKNFTGPQTGVVNAIEAENMGIGLGMGVEGVAEDVERISSSEASITGDNEVKTG